MDIERNKTTVRRVFEEGFWQGRLAALGEFLDNTGRPGRDEG